MKQILTFLFLLAPLALMGQSVSRTELRNTNTQVDARMALKAPTNSPNLFNATLHGPTTFRGGTNTLLSPGVRGKLSHSANGSEYYQTLWWATSYQLYESDSGLRFLTLTNESGSFVFTLKADVIVMDSDEVDFTGQIFGGDIFAGGTNLHTLAATKSSFDTSLIAGTGGANTNFTFSSTIGDAYINGRTNVSIRGIGGTAAARADFWTITITNGSGSDWALEFSAVTNQYRFSGTYGTNAPRVLTNLTQLILAGRSDGTNTQVGYTYMPWP